MTELSINKKDGDILFSAEMGEIVAKINELVKCCNKHGGSGGDTEVTITAFESIENVGVSTPEDPLEVTYLMDEDLQPESVYLQIRYTTSDNKSKTANLDGLVQDLNDESSDFAKSVQKYLMGLYEIVKNAMNYVINNNNDQIGTYLYPFSKRSQTPKFYPCKFREYEEWEEVDTEGYNYIDYIPTMYELFKNYPSELMFISDLRYSSKDPDDYDQIAIDCGHYGRPFTGSGNEMDNYVYHHGITNYGRINHGVYCKELLKHHPEFSIKAMSNNTTYAFYIPDDWFYYRPVQVLADHILTNMFFIIKKDEFANYGGTWDNFVNNFDTYIRSYIDNAKTTTVDFNSFGKYYHNDPHETDLDNKRAYAITKVNEGVMFYGDNEVENETNESNLENFQKTKYDLFIRRYYRESDDNEFWRGANYTYNMYKRGSIDISFEEGDILVFLTKDYTCNSGYNHMFHCMPGTTAGQTAGYGYLNPEAHLWMSGGTSDTEKFATYLETSEYFISQKNYDSSIGKISDGKKIYVDIGYEDQIAVPNSSYTYKRYGGRDYFCWAFKSHVNGCLMDCRTGSSSGVPGGN